ARARASSRKTPVKRPLAPVAFAPVRVSAPDPNRGCRNMKTRGRILLSAAAGALLATLATLVGMAGATTAADPPTVRAVPSISGDAREGSTLTTHNGDWGGTKPITFAYQWRRCGNGGNNCADISGATAKTYVLVAADVGHRMRVLVRGAVVYMIGIPYNRIALVPEQETGTDGYVTFTVQPTARFPLVAGGALVVFVRARKPGENLLAGVSTRRLVQASVGAPA